MTLLSTPDANPAYLFALGQSLHWLESRGQEVDDLEDLDDKIGPGGGRLKNCLNQAIDAGMVTREVEAEARKPDVEGLGLTEDWHGAFGPHSTMEDLALCINQRLSADKKGLKDLHAISELMLQRRVFADEESLDDVVESWDSDLASRGLTPLNRTTTQLDDLSRWCYFLGWVRRLGRATMVPDFTGWLLAWLRRHPRPPKQLAADFWSELCVGLPVLKGFPIGAEQALPEPLSIALLALEERGRCRFVDRSDSPETLMLIQVGGPSGKTVKARWVEWDSEGGRS